MTRKSGHAQVRRWFEAGLADHQAGRLTAAEAHYAEVLRREPRHADALHLSGIVAFQLGRFDQAIDRYQRSLAAQPNSPDALNNLGLALRAAGREPEAVARYRQALGLRPDYPEALENLGVALLAQGQPEAAADRFEQALALRPNHPDTLYNLGLALQQQGRLAPAVDRYQQVLALRPGCRKSLNNLGMALKTLGRPGEAAARFQQALALQPDDPEALNNLGIALLDQDRPEDAAVRFEQALGLKPDYPEALNNLGIATLALGRLAPAADRFRAALAIRPDYPEALNNLGNALQKLGRLAEAVASLERALVLKPDYPEALYNLGLAFQDQGRPDQAVARFHQALNLKADDPDTLNALGNACVELGRLDQALTAYDRALAIRPDHARTLYNRADLKRFHAEDADLATLEALVREAGRRPDHEAVFLHFALGKALDDAGLSARAFAQFQAGNALKRRQVIYDETATRARFRQIAERFDPALFQRHQGTGDPSAVPIFVVGMPRSGSTLIEQILASHPQVLGAGELGTLPALLDSQASPYPDFVPELSNDALARLGRDYLAGLPPLPPGHRRITDKMPSNFLNLGLIRLILPNARIIHTVRDPADTCMSCFSKLFAMHQEFSFDLGELGRYYRWYRELMAHWRTVLPAEAILEVRYEAVVADIETEARRLIAYCGLPWDERCLEFHKAARSVRTASAAQVRQPLFRSSLDRSGRFRDDLEPLLRELGSDAAAAGS